MSMSHPHNLSISGTVDIRDKAFLVEQIFVSLKKVCSFGATTNF